MILIIQKSTNAGSPPQVRGKRLRACPTAAQDGITPAGAGKTQSAKYFILPTKDHPRRCGENVAIFFFMFYLSGSPPQVRGKHRAVQLPIVKIGITPAGAGKTLFVLLPQITKRDHPRRCGENLSCPPTFLALSGSPPQVRGKQPRIRFVNKNCRITPAGAGKTSDFDRQNARQKDHPRRCGEN